ncbi:MAG: hypothetical protein ABJA20_15085, partial [Novosphingobium sp.]
DWIGEGGFPCQKVAPFDAWLEQFETTLRALPEASRRASLLPLMAAYSCPPPAVPGTQIATARFAGGVRETMPGGVGEIPHVGPQLIAKYLADLRASGLLEGG